MRFTNKGVVVTGGATGIVFAVAKQLCDEGAVVAILGRREEKLREATLRIVGDSSLDRFLWYSCDISEPEEVKSTFDSIREQFSVPLYALINNAGIPCRKTVLDTTPEDLQRTFATNIFGAQYCAQAALEQMLEHGNGSIVNVSSVGALRAFDKRTPYNASKAALLSLTESIARDYAAQGIRANSVCPGYVRTEMTAPYFDAMDSKDYEALIAKHAMNRIGKPEEIAQAVCFLLSEDASFITGQHLAVDGGYLLGK